MEFREKVSEELVKRLKSKQWHRHGIYTTVILWSTECWTGLSREDFRLEGIDKGMENSVVLGPEFFVEPKEFEEFCEIFDAKLQDGIPYLKNYIREYNKDMDIALEKSVKIGSGDFSRMSNTELGQRLKAHFDTIRPLHHWLWSMEFLNESFDRKIHALMKRVYPTWSAIETDAFLGNASYTPKRQFFQKEQDELVVLSDANDVNLKKLYEKYKWLNMYFIKGSPFTFAEYTDRVRGMLGSKKEITKKIEQSRKDVENAKKLVETVEDPELKEYLYLMQELSYLKTYRIDIYTICFSHIIPLRDEIMARLGITYEDFVHYTCDELVSALEVGKKLSKSEVEKRQKWCVLEIEDEIYYFKDAAVEEVRKAIWDDSAQIEELKGTIAYPGVVRGRVKVSFMYTDTGKVEKGDILVCNLTNPDYNPLFPKLAGIVTDEGGVLCHSAIMAREFKIPCVIGTKVATKYLKDGDMVEVDADKGIVKKL